jgi:hypothetical protein
VKVGVGVDEIAESRRLPVVDEDGGAVEAPSVCIPSQPTRIVARHVESPPQDRVHRHISQVWV